MPQIPNASNIKRQKMLFIVCRKRCQRHRTEQPFTGLAQDVQKFTMATMFIFLKAEHRQPNFVERVAPGQLRPRMKMVKNDRHHPNIHSPAVNQRIRLKLHGWAVAWSGADLFSAIEQHAECCGERAGEEMKMSEKWLCRIIGFLIGAIIFLMVSK